jgi:hypothetical protein
MRVTSIAATLMLALEPEPAFDQNEFCLAVTDIARRKNARMGRWLDRSTRFDGVTVDCDSRTFEVERYLHTDPDAMRPGWEARKTREWNSAYCENEDWREAIDNGWRITSKLTFRTGDQSLFVAECE